MNSGLRLGFFLSLLSGLAQSLLISFTATQDLKEGSWFVMFHVEWCKYCTEVKPQFSAAAFASKHRFITIDCVRYHDLCLSYSVTSFPFFAYLIEGEKVIYDGGYHPQDFQDYAQKMNSPTTISITSETWQEEVAKHACSFTLTYSPVRDQSALQMFERVAERQKLQPTFFFAVPWPETKVIVTTRDKNDRYELTNFSERDLQKFVHLHKLPTLVEISSDSLQRLKRVFGHKLLIVLALNTHDLDAAYRLQHFYREARLHRSAGNDRVQFCFLNFHSPDTQIDLLELNSLPAVVAMDIEGEVHLHTIMYDPTTDLVHQFVVQVLNGEEVLRPLNPGLQYAIKTYIRRLHTDEGSMVDLMNILLAVFCAVLAFVACKMHFPSKKPKKQA